MRNLSSISDDKDILTKEYLDDALTEINDSIDSLRNRSSVFYGTCSTVAATEEKAVTCDDFVSSDLIPGVIVNVKFGATNSAAIANLTLNVNNTGAKSIKYLYNGNYNNIPSAAYLKADQIYQFTYDGTYWIVQMGYNSNTVPGQYYFPKKTYTDLYRYMICLTKDDQYILPVNTVSNTTATTKELTSEEFDPFGEIYYNASSSTSGIAAGEYPGSNTLYTSYSSGSVIDLRYSFNTGTSLVAKKDIYLVCVPKKNGRAVLAPNPIRQELPTTDDGLIYIHIGQAYDKYRINLNSSKPVYFYSDGAVRLWTNSSVDAKMAEYNTDEDVFQIRHAKAEKPSYNSEVVRKITGGTLAWNQMISSDHKSYTNSAADTRTAVWLRLQRNGSPYETLATENVTSSGSIDKIFNSTLTDRIRLVHNGSVRNFDFIPNSNYSITANHKYYFHMDFASADPTTVGGVQSDNLMIFDLTQMFGSTIADRIYALEQATAGAGVAWFRRYFNRDYYEPAQTLANTYFDQYETTGFNQYNGVPTLGKYWNNGTLASIGSNAHAAIENKIRCIPNTAYCVSFPNAVKTHDRVFVTFFDAYGIFLRTIYSDVATASKYVFTTDSDCHMFAISFYTDSSTFADGDFNSFCINLSDASRNGQYEPYRYSRITFFDDPVLLRGIPYLDENDNLRFNGDTLEANGKLTKRYGIVDLGTLNWVVDSYGFRTSISGKTNLKSSTIPVRTCICDRYVFSYALSNDKTFSESAVVGNTNFWVKDSAYSDAATFKAAMSGVMLVYELATPTEEEFTPIDGPLVSDPLGLEVIAKSDWDDTPTIAQMDILYANEVRANVEMIATNKVIAMQKIDNVEDLSVSTEISRKRGNKKILVVKVNGIENFKGTPKIFVYTCPRRKGTYYWRHPVDANNVVPVDPSTLKKIGTKYGYASLTTGESKYGSDPSGVRYPPVPDWMPDNGYLRTEFDIPIGSDSIEIVLPEWIVPLYKPNGIDLANNELSWSPASFMGTRQDRAPILFRFVAADSYNDGTARVFHSTNATLAIGLRRDAVLDLSDGPNTSEIINLYISLR